MGGGAFKDKIVIVTGGTRGIGKAIALAFAGEGARVCVNYFSDKDSAGHMERALSEKGNPWMVLQADVSSRIEVEEMVRQVLTRWGHVDVLVNNAGIIRDKMLLFLKEEDWDHVIDTNLKGTYLVSRAVLRSMVARRFGRIINITSPSALTGRAGQTNYSASKGGIISFTKSLAREVARLGITVNAVCPGLISRSMTDRLDAKTREEFLEIIPMGRFGDPWEVASAALYLASERAGYITGQVLSVDGGLT
ncbi:MAG: 3-oxoacyl-[acyl-carrier-protein] reductase [Deltaproteobacteria bacterium]|nr:3-oxoacyl-[acyl-carrier-protein] reductase [Deltaproteobacteria bacterium]